MAISRRALLKGFVATGVGAATGAGAYGYLYQRRALELTRATLPVAGLPPGLAGLRIGLMTDIHRSRWVSAEDVSEAVRLLMAEAPDLIVIGGDYVTWGDRQYVGASADALGALHAPHGVFGILGNHDDDHDMPAALVARGVQMLKDARTRLTIGRETLELAGIRFWTKRAVDIAAVLRGAAGPLVLLAHDPRRLTEAAALERAARPLGAHARWSGRPSGRGRRGGQKIPGRGRHGAARTHNDVREPRHRHGVRAGTNQLPA